MTKLVPNQQPRLPAPYCIAFIGEAPGETEESTGLPFVGKSGGLLWAVAAKHGIIRDACFVGNVCQHRPPENKISNFGWDSAEIRMGLAQLAADLELFKPNLCVLLGGTALRAFTGEYTITNWRGSLLHGSLNNTFYKCLPTLHPAAILREYQGKCLLDLDLRRARLEGTSPTISLPERDLRVELTFTELLEQLHYIKTKRPTIAIDIEGYWNNISCISIATSPNFCFVLPFDCWEHAEERELLKALALVLTDPYIPKILQNCLYDTFCLQYGYRIPVRGIVDDTMLAHWELFCELPKSLAFQASIYTREPYWKDEREDESRKSRLLYCAKDSAVTYECRNAINTRLRGGEFTHYRFNMNCLEPLLYMELKGILYDKVKAKKKADWCYMQVHRLQSALDRIVGIKVPSTYAEWLPVMRDAFCFKRSLAHVHSIPDILPHCKLTCLHLAQRCIEILSQPTLSPTDVGELSMLTKLSLNVDSSDQIADYLYRSLGLPIQFKKVGGRLTDNETTDVLALLTLYKKTNDQTLKLILKIRSLRTRIENLEAITDPDGRIRCGYNEVGSKTGRLACYESPTGSGFNLQTATKKDRDLFLPDPGYWFFQCDLSGADGWTVAAHCYNSGDRTMLDDYQFGLKPARIIALVYQHGREVLSWTRDHLKAAGKSIDSDGWLYFACKRVQHGSNYGMKGQTMSNTILKDSYKLFGEPIYVAPKMCEQLQALYFLRYPGILKWHQRIKQQLKSHGYIISASGHKRTFFDRREDYDTFKDACADEPQNNTTYACNSAILKLWTDPANRISIGVQPGSESSPALTRSRARTSLRIQPLHQVHDAVLGQFRKEETEWSVKKINEYFNNPITIAGVPLVIPFEGAYGESWGSLKQGTI